MEEQNNQTQAEIMDQLIQTAQEAGEETFIDESKIESGPELTDTGDTLRPEEQEFTDPPENQFQNGTIKLGQMVQAKPLMHAFDMAVSGLMAFGATKILKRGVDAAYFKMDSTEKKINADALQNWLNSINLNIENPLTILLITLAATYGGKISVLAGDIAAEKFENPQAPIKKAGRGRPKKAGNNAEGSAV